MTAEEYIKLELKRFLDQNNISHISPVLEKPKLKKFGDFSSNLPMQLASILKNNPHNIAQNIIQFIDKNKQYLHKVEIAGPGFINFFITKSSIYNQMKDILTSKEKYGKSNIGQGKKTQVEFISANPTGPLTIGNGRQAVLGDTIARLLEALEYDVTREYYYNDAGRQMRILADSVRLRYLQLLEEGIEFPEELMRKKGKVFVMKKT